MTGMPSSLSLGSKGGDRLLCQIIWAVMNHHQVRIHNVAKYRNSRTSLDSHSENTFLSMNDITKLECGIIEVELFGEAWSNYLYLFGVDKMG